MMGKKYTLTLEKIKAIYEGTMFLDAFAELKITGTYSYRLGRLRDHLEPIMTRFTKTDRALKQQFKGNDGKIDVDKYRCALDNLLEKEYEGVYLPEFTMSGLCTKDESGIYKLAVPQKLISALSFHIINDIDREEEDQWATPTLVQEPKKIEEEKEVDKCEYIPE